MVVKVKVRLRLLLGQALVNSHKVVKELQLGQVLVSTRKVFRLLLLV